LLLWPALRAGCGHRLGGCDSTRRELPPALLAQALSFCTSDLGLVSFTEQHPALLEGFALASECCTAAWQCQARELQQPTAEGRGTPDVTSGTCISFGGSEMEIVDA